MFAKRENGHCYELTHKQMYTAWCSNAVMYKCCTTCDVTFNYIGHKVELSHECVFSHTGVVRNDRTLQVNVCRTILHSD